jgi:hypothetical protein
MTDQPLRDREDAEAEPADDLLEPQPDTRPGVDGADESDGGETEPDE